MDRAFTLENEIKKCKRELYALGAGGVGDAVNPQQPVDVDAIVVISSNQNLNSLVQLIDHAADKHNVNTQITRMFIEIYNTWFITHLTDISLNYTHRDYDLYSFSISDPVYHNKLQIAISSGHDAQDTYTDLTYYIDVIRNADRNNVFTQTCTLVRDLIEIVKSPQVQDLMRLHD